MNATPRTEAKNDATAEASAAAEGKSEANDPAARTDKTDTTGKAETGKAGTAAERTGKTGTAAEQTDKAVGKTGAKTVGGTAEAPVAVDASDSDDVDDDSDDDALFVLDEEPPARPASAAAGAGAIVSAGLALSALTGTWSGQILADREKVDSQLHLTQSSSVTAQIEGLYGNGWHMTALVNGGFALLALLVGIGVLVALRPAASALTAAAPRPVWMRAVAWGGVVLAILGLIISAGMYFDLFASLPTAPAAPAS